MLEEEILAFRGRTLPGALLARAKKDGFADRYLAMLLDCREGEIRAQRQAVGAVAGWEPVPVSGVEDAAYYYSTYNAPDRVAGERPPEDHGARRRAQPHRPGHRVRLLLRTRGLCHPRCRF